VINRYFTLLWHTITNDSVPEKSEREAGEFELDGSYFGVRRIGEKGEEVLQVKL
jgi:hypothetical protein